MYGKFGGSSIDIEPSAKDLTKGRGRRTYHGMWGDSKALGTSGICQYPYLASGAKVMTIWDLILRSADVGDHQGRVDGDYDLPGRSHHRGLC